MKKNNIFSLAISYDAYTKHLQPITSHPHPQPNIFKKDQSIHCTQQELNHAKSYEIVGLKELMTYQNRMKKMHKLTAKRQILPQSERFSPKDATNREVLMDRGEVIDSLPKLVKNKTTNDLHNSKRESWMTEFSQSKSHQKTKKTQQYKNEFSVSRIKNKLKAQETEWKKVMRTDHENPKFPSIHKSIENYREKAQQKQKNSLQENQQHMKSSVWSQVLRSNMNLMNVYDQKAVARTFHDEGEFTTKGKSKLKLESLWLEKKDSEGYRFKLHHTETSPKGR